MRAELIQAQGIPNSAVFRPLPDGVALVNCIAYIQDGHLDVEGKSCSAQNGRASRPRRYLALLQ